MAQKLMLPLAVLALTTACGDGRAGRCGNGHLESSETCDGTLLGTETCATQGFYEGTLVCNDTCSGFDTTGCSGQCGDGEITNDEVCDGISLGEPERSCEDEGYRAGVLACAEDCLSFDTSGCTDVQECGNGTIEFPEECDLTVPDGADCTARGFDSGPVGCTDSCTFDKSACIAEFCGDGIQNRDEECDNTDIDTGCEAEGFEGGVIACRHDCTLELAGCTGGCGNGVVDGSDLCDGEDVAGRTCADEGFYTGVLGCLDNCSTLDTSGCQGVDAACVADGDSLGEMTVGDAIRVTGSSVGATDDMDLSCQFVVPMATREVAHEVVVTERGRLHVMAASAWHVTGLMAEPSDGADCFTTEVACANPFIAGNSLDMGDVDPGRYYIVFSDWSETSRWYDVVVTLNSPGGEVCNNHLDDDWDGMADCGDTECAPRILCAGETSCTDGSDNDLDMHTDCADPDCVDSTACSGSACAPDQDLGTLAPYTPAGGSIDVASFSNDLGLPCAPSDGPDHVTAFSLAAPARLLINLDQAATTSHAMALALQAGPGSGCTEAVYRCIDLTESTDTPDLYGWISAEPFPTGSYFLVLEGTTTGAGTVSLHLTAYDPVETTCEDSVDNDGDGRTDCSDMDCISTTSCSGSSCTPDHDLGELRVGESVVHEVDTSGASNTLHLGCAPANGADHVYSFTLPSAAFVWLDVDQAPGTGHATALAFSGGPGSRCDDEEHLCLDLTDVDSSPDAFGYLTVPEKLPAGTYYIMHEVTGTAGNVRLRLAASSTIIENDCTDGTDDDGDGKVDCTDPQCASSEECTARGIYERFEGGGTDDFDLGRSMLTLTPVPGHPAGYVLSAGRPAPLFPTQPGSGSSSRPLDLGDNGSSETALPRVFDFFEVSQSLLTVWSNGLITFGPTSGSVGFVESVDDLFKTPTLALLWDDLDPGSGGTVTYDEHAERVAVTFDSVPEVDPTTYEATGASSFQAVLWDDGHIDIAWLDVTCSDGIVGVADGSGIQSKPAETDLD